MKNILFITYLLAMSSSLCVAQGYQKLLKNDNYWSVTSCHFGCTDADYWTEEDTLIGGETFRFLNGYHYNRNMCIREDTITRQVFFWNSLSNKKALIYDFSVNLGDTVKISNPLSPLPPNQGDYLVDSIRIRNILAGPRRFFYLSQIAGSDQTLWVEGIGSLALINTPGSPPDLNGVGELSCFFQNAVKVYETDSSVTGTCDSILIQTHLSYSKQTEIILYPNPSRGNIQIKLGEWVEHIKIELVNLLGQSLKVFNYSSVENLELDLNDYKGLYFLNIQIDQQNNQIKRILLK